MKEMGEVTMEANGLLPKISSLFNSQQYSDIQFVFMNKDGTIDRIYCHKLILALQSKYFADQFFKTETSPSTMKMLASKKKLFYLLFKFLYTGDVKFSTFEEAQDLCELAEDYLIEELVKKCYTYMLQDRVTIRNICSRYERAIVKQLYGLLEECRNFVRANIQKVLKSDEFVKASTVVVEDIVTLDNLPLSTEYEIIIAVLNWGLEYLSQNKIPNTAENLRESINPFLKHLRILSLTSFEFQDLVKKYNIFSAYESTMLFQKIMLPQSADFVLENFCCITSKRGTAVLNFRTTAEHNLYDVFGSNSSKSTQPISSKSTQPILSKSTQLTSPKSTSSSSLETAQSTSTKSISYISPKSAQSATPKSAQPALPKSVQPTLPKSAQFTSPKSTQPTLLKSVQPTSPKSTQPTSPKSTLPTSPKSTLPTSLKSVQQDPPKSLLSDNNNKITYEVRKYPTKNDNVSSGFKQRVTSYPDILDIELPALSFSQNLRDFLFPLKKNESFFKFSFPSDIKCWVTMAVRRGNLTLYGLELKMKKKNNKQELVFSVHLQNFSKQPINHSYKMELQSDVLSVKFPKPIKLQEGNKGKLEVVAEDVSFDCCSQIAKSQFELNSGLNFECEFCIGSNKKAVQDEEFLFLINKLIYAPN